MSRPYQNITRRNTKTIKVGNVSVGGNSPISVQTMTNTLTSDIESTVHKNLYSSLSPQ